MKYQAVYFIVEFSSTSGLKYASSSMATGMHVHNFFLQKKRYGVPGKRKWQQ